MKVAIAGSGVMGLCTAYYLQKAGYDVIVIEKDSGPSGASMGNAGMIVPSHFTPLSAPGVVGQALKWLTKPSSPFSIKPRLDFDLIRWGLKFLKASNSQIDEKRKVLYELNFRSRELFEDLLSKEDFNIGFKPLGLSMYCRTEKALEEEKELIEISEALGQKAVYMDNDTAQSHDPGLDLDIAGAVFYPNDAFLAPHDLMNQLREIIQERGGKFINEASVSNLIADKKTIVGFEAAGEIIEADEFVLAAGVWSSGLAKKIGVRIPLQAGKGYSFTLDSPAQLPQICSILVEARIAVTPMKEALRFAGTMEIVGLDDRVNRKKTDGIIQSIPEFFPQFKKTDFQDLPIWHGFRPCSPDGLPYIGRTQKFNNLTIATGHAMMGLSLGPVTGKMVCESLLENKTPHPLLLPDRY